MLLKLSEENYLNSKGVAKAGSEDPAFVVSTFLSEVLVGAKITLMHGRSWP